ncbi:type III secretion system translocon subunit SctE [Endozoicomonas sp.]|uniref:type III secretion system translocon subunit SctE n=1 Tax=Endozoicomonas sp. TaxID=1892382 RepID=UPI002884BF50|nr:type III secretion system translocon subunit SctE [Endozoicomonas sp.]
MSGISQGPQSASTDKAIVNPSVLDKTNQAEDARINRGYPAQNSVSSVIEQDDAQAPQVQHRMDAPAEGADSPSEKVLKEIAVFKEIQNAVNAEPEAGDALLGEFLLEKVDQKFFDGALGRQNPLARDISALQSNKGHLLSLGYSEELIDGLLSLADPNDPDNSLAGMHSFSTRIAGKLGGDDSLEKLHSLFGDTLGRVANLKGGPAGLHAQLQAGLKGFNAAFLDSNKHIDVDSATLMLMQIQTQLQNNRLIFDQQNIKISQVAREQISEKRMNKILDSIEKANKAKKAGVVSKIFGGIAVALMAVVAAVMIAGAIFTGGASAVAAAGLMVAATALVMTMMVSSETGNWMMEMFGDSEKGQIGAMVFWSVLILAMTLGAAGITGAAGSAAATTNAAGAGAGAAAGGAGGATVTASAATAATTASRIARLTTMAARFSRTLRIAGGASMVGDGSASAVSTTYQYEADMLRAEAKELYAWMLHNQHVIDDLVEDIQKVIEELQQGFSAIAGILKDNNDTKTKLLGLIKG